MILNGFQGHDHRPPDKHHGLTSILAKLKLTFFLIPLSLLRPLTTQSTGVGKIIVFGITVLGVGDCFIF